MVKVLVKRLDSKVKIPQYKTSGSSGMDLMAFIEKPIKIPPNNVELIPTGLSIAIPDNLDAISINPAGLGIDRGKQNGIYIPFDSVFTTYFSNRFNGFGNDLNYEFIDKSFPNLFNPSDGNIGF